MNVRFFVDAEWPMADVTQVTRRLSGASLSEFMMREVSPFLRKRASIRFAVEGDHASGAWDPLGYMSQKNRILLGFGAEHPINVRTGDLRDWVLGNYGEITKVTEGSTELTWPGETSGELDEKFTTAQVGKGTPPTQARPVAAADELDLAWILSGIQEWIGIGR